MNNFKKQAALSKYSPALQSQTIEEIEAMVKADEKAYTEDEVKEIMEALKATEVPGKAPEGTNSEDGTSADANDKDVVTTEIKEGEDGGLDVKVTGLKNGEQLETALQSFGRQKTYEECKVTIIREDGKEPVIKKGEVIRTVRIEPEVAEAHNKQTLNSKIAYYEVEGA